MILEKEKERKMRERERERGLYKDNLVVLKLRSL